MAVGDVDVITEEDGEEADGEEADGEDEGEEAEGNDHFGNGTVLELGVGPAHNSHNTLSAGDLRTSLPPRSPPAVNVKDVSGSYTGASKGDMQQQSARDDRLVRALALTFSKSGINIDRVSVRVSVHSEYGGIT